MAKAEWVIEPKEMASFLNEVAMKTDDEETRFKLAQCSIFVYTMYRALYKDDKTDVLWR